MFKQILVAVDGTATSRRAFATAVALARVHDATLHAVHVIDEAAIAPAFDGVGFVSDYATTIVEDLRQRGRTILSEAEAGAAAEGARIEGRLVDSEGATVAQAILAHAARVRADLIVLGTHGRRGVRRLVMGSDAEGVVREADVPVLLVRARDEAR